MRFVGGTELPDQDLTRARWEALDRRHIMATYPRRPLAVRSAQGAWVWGTDGRRYLDFVSGVAVTGLGHAHPAVAEAVAGQVASLTHASNLYLTEPMLELARSLSHLAGIPDARVFFANSGAEANEAALKLARRHGKRQDRSKVRVVVLEGSFHGRTLATLEATGQPEKQEPFLPLAGFVDRVPFDDADALHEAVRPDTCAVMLEVIQGEGGVREVPRHVLEAARSACDAQGALLIVDEVQTGMGRTGRWFAHQDTGVLPDVITIAKALGNGLPISACIATHAVSSALEVGDHGSTFGGSPVCAAAANAVVRTMREHDLVRRAEALGVRIREQLDVTDGIREVRGRGLLIGLVPYHGLAAEVESAARSRGLLVNAVTRDVVRLCPPLTLTDEEARRGLTMLAEALQDVAADLE